MKIPLRQYLDLLANYLQSQRRKVIVLGVLLLAQMGLQLANPQILRVFIDNAAAGASIATLVNIALLFIGVALSNQLVLVVATFVSQSVSWTATNALRADLAAHCLALDMAFHKTRSPGEWIERIDGDVSTLAQFFSQFIVLLLGNAFLMVGVLVVLWLEDWRVGLTMSACALLALYALNRGRNRLTPYRIAERRAEAAQYGFLEERLAGLEDIRANGAGAYVMRRFYERAREVYVAVVHAMRVDALLDITTQLSFTLSFIVALAMGAWLFSAGLMTIGSVYLIVRYAQMLRDPIQQMTRQLQDLQKASAGIVRVRELFNLRSQIADGTRHAAASGAASVEFDGVSFEYDDTMPQTRQVSKNLTGLNGNVVLHDLSFHLPPGQVLGLLGRTGSGKTTITRLLTRLYDPTAGAIRLTGVDIRTMRLADLRRGIGIVTQDVQLFQATLRDNLTLFRDDVADERIARALDELGLSDWYRSLPYGLDTELAPGGAGLSAGQAQLLTFVRVLLKDPSLVILDEASSRLDPVTQQVIERAVDTLLCQRTGIIIAHRLDTVQRADLIMMLEDGRIGEYGAREALARDPRSRFYRLLQTGMEDVLV